MKYDWGKERIMSEAFAELGCDNVVRWDVIDTEKNIEREFVFNFISTNSKYLQGVRIAIDYGDGYFIANKMKLKEFYLWEDTCPHNMTIKYKTKEGKISVYNAYDKGPILGRGGVRTQMDSCGMLVEVKGNRRIYRCNDSGFNTDFNSVVFEITML